MNLKRLRQAAQKGDRDAQFELGCLYRRGEGVRRNRIVALKWLILSAWDGDSDADFQVKLLADELGEKKSKRALKIALGWKFDKDKNSIIEQLVNSTALFSAARSGEDQGEHDLPTFVKMS